MMKLYHSYLSPYARRVLIVLAEKGLEHEREKHMFAREFMGLSSINPCLLLPVLTDDGMHLWGSNLIIEYLLRHYPGVAPGSPEPPLAAAMTRADHHWEDAKVLATIETMTDSVMNLRQMKMSHRISVLTPALCSRPGYPTATSIWRSCNAKIRLA